MYHHSYMGCISNHPHLEIIQNTFNIKTKVEPLGHLQVYEPGLSIHVPPFIHGLYKQSSSSGNNKKYMIKHYFAEYSTHLSPMEFPTLITWTSQFLF